MILGIDYHWLLTGLIFVLHVALFFLIKHLRTKSRLGPDDRDVLMGWTIIFFIPGGLTLLAFIKEAYLAFWIWWSIWSICVIFLIPVLAWGWATPKKQEKKRLSKQGRG